MGSLSCVSRGAVRWVASISTPSLLRANLCKGSASPDNPYQEDLDDFDIELSPGWRILTEFRKSGGAWTSNSFCLRAVTYDTYELCGEEGHGPPPSHRALPPWAY